MHREQVMDLLWPDLGKKAASNNLRQTLHAARGFLDPTAGTRYLASEDESLVLFPGGSLWVDVEVFEKAALTARRSGDPAAYRAAIDLYVGDLLPEDRYEAWAEGRHEVLRQLYLTLLIELAGLHEERDEYEAAIEALRKATAKEPTLEEAHAGLMRLHALSGRPEQALAQYDRLCNALSRTLGTEPAATTRRLRDEIAAGRLPPALSAGPSLMEPSVAGRHNLPTPRTSFVGREREIVEVKRTLSMTRLLTLTGAGGSGKTRLALEVARDLIGAYPDGVWLVELAPLSEPGLVAQEAAGALGLTERPGEPLTDTLVESVGNKEVLLLVDNCEHLVGAVARLVDALLDSCLRLRVLATSREPLGIQGEVLWQVPPLSLPTTTDGELNGRSAVEGLLRYEALRLFVDRARLRLPDFGLTEGNAGAVARVCRKLDGIPLAIELATARMGTLALEQIAQRLESSLNLLSAGSRTAEPRQQTLRATLEWSHDLLSEAERAMFRSLSVFAGGWTLEAAEAVCFGDGIERDNLLDILGGLVDKSLVLTATTTVDAVRYGMLEPIRQYAKEKLEHSGESEEVKGRHVAYFLALASEAEATWQGPEESTWLDLIEDEHDNLRAALSWSLEGGDPNSGLPLAAAVSWFWDGRGHLAEGTRWLEKALAEADVTITVARADALRGLGNILLGRGDFEGAEARLEEGLALYEGLGDRGAGVATSLASLGFVARRSDTARAAALFEESLAVARESENHRIVPDVLNGLGWTAFDDGEFERAQALWEEALELDRQLGSKMVASNVLMNMGYTELARGDHERATKLVEEGLAIGRQLGDKSVVSTGLFCLGIAATLRGQPNEAKGLLKASFAIDVELGNNIDIPEGLEALAGVAGALGQDLRAARLWGAAGALREEIGVQWAPAERMLHEPQLAAARSRVDGAIWETGFGEGQLMGFEEAIEYALSEEDTAVPEPLALGQPSAGARSDALTRREQEVAVLVARGLTNRQIASALTLSEHTIATHIRNVLKKLGLDSRNQVAAWVREHQPLP
jgi:predicted ATPase/DNA-binding SARP family transcriptional activator/DNA-binding CsgD family transcriptional regulator